MIDRAAHDLAERMESDLICQREFVDAQVAGEDVAGRSLPGSLILQPVYGIEREPASLETLDAFCRPFLLSELIRCFRSDSKQFHLAIRLIWRERRAPRRWSGLARRARLPAHRAI